MTEGVRLQKYLARAGVSSRRHAEELIRTGRVQLNGAVVTAMGLRVRPGVDRVAVDGRTVRAAAAVWIALHKPRGVVSTRRDPEGRRTVYDLLPPAHRRLFHVGRLDHDSAGLLLLTNEGEGANRLLHPRYGVEREYEIEVEGVPGREALERLRSGVVLDDGLARAHDVRTLPARPGAGRLRLIMVEGRNREVRRMLEAVGHRVLGLRRVRYGPIRLGDLPPGEWRVLDRSELEAIRLLGRPDVRS
jgi:23S rRNA pseudouridine2605 synthase